MSKWLVGFALIPCLAWAEPASMPASAPMKHHAGEGAKMPGANLMGDQAVVHRGAKFTDQAPISMDALAAKPGVFAGKTLKVTGKVLSVCKKKGCWMVLQGTTPADRARITFKDYGFFVPLDAKGTLATVEGVVSIKKLSAKEREHLAKDAGKKIDAMPASELRITATAAEVRRGDL